MTHDAFVHPDNLNGAGANTWIKKAEDAESKKLWNLAAKYWSNAAQTSLSARKSAIAGERQRKCLEKGI